MKAFKGFNPDLTCRGFQYKEGETFETDEAKLCSSGFHACERPLDCFGYYAPANAVYHEVELDGVTNEKEDDTKRCGTRIKIGARLSVADICRLTFDYVKEHCTNENNAEAGKPATAGEYGAATAGDSGAATAGDSGAATAGEYGAATAGNYGAATAGYKGAATAGEYGAATSRGSAAVGASGIACVKALHPRAKGGLDAVLVLAKEDYSGKVIDYVSAVVDGEKVKVDVWYTVENGQLIECE